MSERTTGAVAEADYSSLNLLRDRRAASARLTPSFPRGCCPEMRYVCSLKMGAIVFDYYWSLSLSVSSTHPNERTNITFFYGRGMRLQFPLLS